MMNKLLVILFSLLAGSLEAATITNWGAQLPTAVPAGGDILLMQKGGVTYYFTPNQLATQLSTNVNMAVGSSDSNALYSIETTRNAAVSNAVVALIPANGLALPISSVQFNSNGVQQGSSGFIFTGSKVGIGTTNPAINLEVNGGIKSIYVQSGTNSSNSVLVIDGDSRSFGGGGYVAGGLATTESFTMFNTSVSGTTLAQMLTNSFAAVDSRFSWAARRNIVAIWGGINNFYFGQEVSATYDQLVAYAEARRKAGWKVIVFTEISHSGFVNDGNGGAAVHTTDSYTTALNGVIRAHWSEFADGLVDLGATTTLGATNAHTNTVYFLDGVHLTVAGNLIVSNLVVAAINRLTQGQDSRGTLTSQALQVLGENGTYTGTGSVEIAYASGVGQLTTYNRASNTWSPQLIRNLYTVFQNSGAEVMRVTNVGVGILTTAPAFPLDVSGIIKSDTSLRVYKNGSDSVGVGPTIFLSNVAGDRAWIQQVNAANGMDFWRYDGTSWDRVVTVTLTGNAGIGTTSPLGKLHVVGGIVQTNGGIWQTWSLGAPSAPATQGAVYWNDGTNICAVFRNAAGTLSTNKLDMTAWP